MPGIAADVDIAALDVALGGAPPVVRAEAFVYPGAVPAFETADGARRQRPDGDRLRLYVHVPFCNYHCDYCHFATRVDDSVERRERYLDAVVRELEWIGPGTPLSQLFVGGGTPTALAPGQLDRLLGAVFERTTRVPGNEHTCEGSPESITGAHLEVLARRGVGRLSMGVQSLDDAVLGSVRRRHDRRQVLAAVDQVLETGRILNVDLIYGLPGQTEQGFRRDVQTLAERGVHSFTLYALRVRDGSSVGRDLGRRSQRLGLARLLRWRACVADLTAELGLVQARPHTFKRPGSLADRHHREVCFDGSVRGFQLGVGLSARSQLGEHLFRNHADLETYVDAVESGREPVESVFRLRPDDRSTKFIARSLGEGQRLRRADYAAAFGRAFDDDHGEALSRLVPGGLLTDDGDSLEMTALGRLVYDRVLVNFYPQRARDWLRQDA